jgi:polyisoprenoid-binding protein YceI
MTESTTTDVTSLLADGTAAGNWVLDSAGSHAEFGVRHFWGAITVRGTFERMTGEATVGPDGTVTGRISFDAASLNTKNKQRDKHLRSADFFQADKFPHITFSVDRLQPSSEGVTVIGQLTVRGQTRPVTFPARVSVVGSGEVRLDAEVRVNRADFGLTWNQWGMASMKNTITVHAVFGQG